MVYSHFSACPTSFRKNISRHTNEQKAIVEKGHPLCLAVLTSSFIRNEPLLTCGPDTHPLPPTVLKNVVSA